MSDNAERDLPEFDVLYLARVRCRGVDGMDAHNRAVAALGFPPHPNEPVPFDVEVRGHPCVGEFREVQVLDVRRAP